MSLKVFEAFAGYGSQSIALSRLNIEHEVVAISEVDKYALKAYYSLHDKNIPNLGDISKIKVEDIPKHDLFTYSFPCQDISLAGLQKGIKEGTRSGLLYECKKIIEYHKPKYLLLENVKNLVGKKFKPQFDEWLKYLETLGYTNYWQVLNAKDYGVPQNRERVFVISILGKHKPYKFPEGFGLKKCLADLLEETVEEKYYINKPFKLVDKGRVKAEFTNINFDQAKRIYGTDSYFQTLGAKERGTNNILIEAYLTDFSYKQVSQILSEQGICTTLDTMQGGYREPKILIPQATTSTKQDIVRIEDFYKVRKLTPKECFRLMGLNDKEIDKIQATGLSNAQQHKMAGNSIVVQVLEAIFRELFHNVATKQPQ